MEVPRPEDVIRDEDPAVAAELDRSMEAPLPTDQIREDAPAPAPAAVAVGGGGGGLGALQQLIDHEDRRLQPAAGAGGGSALQQLIELGVEDPRLQAACFFLAWGVSILVYGTVLKPSTNWEHIFVGFVALTIGAGLALLTLAGAGAGRAAARAERFLRGFF
ncbi:hypothetical protein BAE44_0018530 [Dichanthelium oligosanthes]|uniref:Uncharacterized protein n=1 Tax=Dichanthelium oligosanthes TaxID=888268 RepID=A0A1E5V5S2_9POAL|nr:hypothetical protein BAE44_0018530 [Dichanthelium oligosanthes]